MNTVKTRGVCRSEQKDTRWTFAGWATATGAENTVRPRAHYRSCVSCTTLVLTLADVDDAQSFCDAIMSEWLRRAGGAADKIDVDNVRGDLRLHLWHLYNRWLPSGLSFASYAAGIMRKKINTFVASDVGDPTDKGRNPKGHSRSLSSSYDEITAGIGERSGLGFAFGGVAADPTGDRVVANSWLDTPRDRAGDWRQNVGSHTASSCSDAGDRGAT